MQNLILYPYFPQFEEKASTVWVASGLFLGLTWFELVWRKPGNPTHIGTVFVLLLLVTTGSRILLGKTSIEVDPLHLLHHLYAKLRFTVSRPVYKNMLENIANLSNFKGMEYFILLMIGTVTYDGLRWYHFLVQLIWFLNIRYGVFNICIFWNQHNYHKLIPVCMLVCVEGEWRATRSK